MEQMERAYRNRLEITYEQIDSIEKIYVRGWGKGSRTERLPELF